MKTLQRGLFGLTLISVTDPSPTLGKPSKLTGSLGCTTLRIRLRGGRGRCYSRYSLAQERILTIPLTIIIILIIINITLILIPGLLFKMLSMEYRFFILSFLTEKVCYWALRVILWSQTWVGSSMAICAKLTEVLYSCSCSQVLETNFLWLHFCCGEFEHLVWKGGINNRSETLCVIKKKNQTTKKPPLRLNNTLYF